MKVKPQTLQFENEFEEEIYEGLIAFPKHLSSKWFYDKIGDQLFQKIMHLPEYYLTGSEFEILDTHKKNITALFEHENGFDLIELGAGDGKKTKVLIESLMSENKKFTYKPIDISINALNQLEADIKEKWPTINMVSEQGTYFGVLEKLGKRARDRKMVIMVLGSNIGNLSHPQAVNFLKNISQSMSSDDLLFMGFDKKKNPEIILKAYNDSQGVTEAFNKNLLNRINKELEADFDLDAFKHWPTYDPETGTAKSYLVSTKKQTVRVKKLDLEIQLGAWESIHTEISQKYDDSIVHWLAEEAGLQVIKQYSDSENLFTDYVFTLK